MRQVTKAYFVGGGIGSLAGAFFMIRDGNVAPSDITIYEALRVEGGSCDAAGNPQIGYMNRGGRMLNLPTYECLQDLMKYIPDREEPEKSVWDTFIEFNKKYKTEGHARLVDGNRKRVDVTSMTFSEKDRFDLLGLILTPEDRLKDMQITDWFQSSFFKTNFWYMWQTTFAFQTWHSLAELRRYIIRFAHEFVRIETLEGVARTKYNQFDSIIFPLKKMLAEKGVNFVYNVVVDDIDIKIDGEKKTVTSLQITRDGTPEVVKVEENDIVIVQNGSMCDASSLGDMDTPVKPLGKKEATSWILWEKLAAKSEVFGNPSSFTRCIHESDWYSFTVTINDNTKFFDQEIAFSHNEPGTGALVTFKDSNWLMSIVVPKQPHYFGQPANTQVFWGYGLFPDRVGNFVNKRMIECTGKEILQELIGHLRFDPDVLEGAICRTCYMPYITSQFMTRLRSDRPLPVPKGCTNLGFTSQYVEIPDDVVFTVEYSVRAAQMAVYQLLNIKKPIPKVHHYERSPVTLVREVKKAYKGTIRAKIVGFTFKTALVAGVAYAGKLAYDYFKSNSK